MKAFFPSNALLGRNGGDEFCILLPNCTFAEADVQLQQFTKLSKTFSYQGKEHAFYISLGYAEYPTFASDRSQLMRFADVALYEIKDVYKRQPAVNLLILYVSPRKSPRKYLVHRNLTLSILLVS